MTKQVVVVGAGISGLTAAWFIQQQILSAAAAKSARAHMPKLTIVDGSARVGGWINTQRLSTPNNSNTNESHLVELGPRTLRPHGERAATTLKLIYQLGLKDDLLVVPKTSVAAQNRFVMMEGRLNMLPSSLLGLLNSREPVVQGLAWAVAREPFVKSRPARSSLAGAGSNQVLDDDDETIAAFVERRLGRRVVDELVSAVIHGIYAGNVDELSARATLGSVWAGERASGSIAAGIIGGMMRRIGSRSDISDLGDPDMRAFVEQTQKNAALVSLRKGLGSLSDRLREDLVANGADFVDSHAVQINNCKNENLDESASSAPIMVNLANGRSLAADHVVAALPASSLAKLLPPAISNSADRLSRNSAVSVAAVNVIVRGSPADLLPTPGFGFLIPRAETEAAIASRAPHAGLLGVVFDECALAEQDSAKGYTRLTAMLGGHLFDRVFGSPESADLDAITNASVKSITSILRIPSDRIVGTNAAVHIDCIPQYAVGHIPRMAATKSDIASHFNQRLALVGASYDGVGINDCIHGAKLAVGTIPIDTLFEPST